MIDKPIPASYWVLTGTFLAGEYPGRDLAGTRLRLHTFLEAGFDFFVDLTFENERPPYFTVLKEEADILGRVVYHRRFSFPDFGVPSRRELLSALDAVDEAIGQGRRVYLHCVGGIGRTGLTVGCYLIRHGMKPDEALGQLRSLYRTSLQSLIVPQTPETEEQVGFILNWEESGLA